MDPYSVGMEQKSIIFGYEKKGDKPTNSVIYYDWTALCVYVHIYHRDGATFKKTLMWIDNILHSFITAVMVYDL